MVAGKIDRIKMKAKVGEPFRIRLWEDRTKGNKWVPTYDATSLRLISDEYERTRNIRVSDIGMRYFEFLPTVPGVYTITFELRYGWKFSAEQHLAYEVTVTG